MASIKVFFAKLQDSLTTMHANSLGVYVDTDDLDDVLFSHFKDYCANNTIDIARPVTEIFIKEHLLHILSDALDDSSVVILEGKKENLLAELYSISTKFFEKKIRQEARAADIERKEAFSEPIDFIDPRPENERGKRTRL